MRTHQAVALLAISTAATLAGANCTSSSTPNRDTQADTEAASACRNFPAELDQARQHAATAARLSPRWEQLHTTLDDYQPERATPQTKPSPLGHGTILEPADPTQTEAVRRQCEKALSPP